ncbi:TolC family protein [Massilia sp. CF038]|uniref:TolC family protein n=1 Tax=Massilia sp. CF038 TaxID=1881045 RepID=UPI0015B38A08|nr:TolC family protein [Massilia sp. CF038]
MLPFFPRYRRCALLCSLLLAWAFLPGCATLPDHAKTLPPLPVQWDSIRAGEQAGPPARWWVALGDQQLNDLIETALARNRDLSRARLAERVAQVNTALDQAGFGLQLQGGLSASKSIAPAARVVKGASLSGSYALDVWGRQDVIIAIDRLTLGMRMEETEAARWTLTVRVAELYWLLAVIDKKTPLLQANADDASAALDAAQARFDTGVARVAELNQRKTDLALTRAALAGADAQRRGTQLSLAILLDAVPQGFSVAHAVLPTAPAPDFAAGVPAALLDRRPDVRAARLALESALQQQVLVKSQAYPALSLSGVLSSGDAIRKILTDPLASIALGLDLPFLHPSRVRAERSLAQIRVDDAVVAYRDVLYGSLKQVEQLFIDRDEIDSVVAAQQALLDEANSYADVIRGRYELGMERKQALRTATANQRLAAVALIEARQRIWLNYVALCAALGGPVLGPP